MTGQRENRANNYQHLITNPIGPSKIIFEFLPRVEVTKMQALCKRMHNSTIAIAQEKVLVSQSYYFAYQTENDQLELLKVTRGESLTKKTMTTQIKLPHSKFTWINSDLFCVQTWSHKFVKVSFDFNSGNYRVISMADTLV